MNQEIKQKLQQAAETAWEQDQKTNPSPVNPYAYVYGYIAGAQSIIKNPGEWGLAPKAQHDHYMAMYNSLVEWYDKIMGAWCEHVRHQQGIESLQTQNDRYREALERILQGSCSPTLVAKKALKQEDTK